MESRPLLVLVDGHAVAYRAFFAIRSDSFVTSQGEPTNAIYGFTRKILQILEENPTYFAISFDRGMSGRDNIYAEYKGTREKMPDDLQSQLLRIEEVVRAFNIPVLAIDGYEADDVIGTVAQQAEALGCDVRIVTGDGDLLQLVTEHTSVELPERGGPDQVHGPEDFMKKYDGLQPSRLPDLKGLMGDSSDNIPGVKGIGVKGGLKLLKRFGSIEGIYENIDELKGAQRKKLETDREMAFLSKKLATIQRNVPITLELDACITRDYSPEDVDHIFQELEFRSLRRRLHAVSDEELAEQDISDSDGTGPPDIEVVVVDTEQNLDKLVEILNDAQTIAFDVETTSVDQMGCNLVGIGLAVEGERGYYIPVGHISPDASDNVVEGIPSNEQPTMIHQQASLLDVPPPQQLPLSTVVDAIRPALTNPNIKKIAQNAKYDLIVMRRYGINVEPVTHDTMIGEWLAQPDSRNLSLKDMALTRLNVLMTPIKDLIGTGKKAITMARVPIEQAAPYCAADVTVVFSLHEQISNELDDNPALRQLFAKVEMPLVPIIADMEMHGVLLDVPYLHNLSAELSERLDSLEQDIYKISGYGEFNIRSLNQLGDVLFGKLGISTEGLKKTKTGNYSLTADVLEGLRHAHPLIPMVLDHRQLTKLKSTYVDALPELINPHTRRVHTNFNQTGTSTGRFSSNEPNLQNIPIRTEEGRRVRRAFIAPEGHLLLAVDYSQIELRILAHYSEDETLIDAFERSLDIHASTAAAVYRMPIEDIDFEQRSFAKSVNFGLMYGMGPYRLARDSELTYAEARAFIDAYFEQFPGVKRYLDGSKAFAAEHGYVETLYGRRRGFKILQNPSTSAAARQRAEREAINMPIQGTAADILKIAMIDLNQALRQKQYGAKMILQVHDELVLEVPENEIDPVSKLVIDVMESTVDLKVPLRADAKVGRNWLEMEAIS